MIYDDIRIRIQKALKEKRNSVSSTLVGPPTPPQTGHELLVRPIQAKRRRAAAEGPPRLYSPCRRSGIQVCAGAEHRVRCVLAPELLSSSPKTCPLTAGLRYTGLEYEGQGRPCHHVRLRYAPGVNILTKHSVRHGANHPQHLFMAT